MVWLASIMMGDPPSDGCTVELSGIPISVMRHHRLAIGTDDERPLAQRMDLRLEGRATQLRVTGPRYGGARRLEAGECSGGALVSLEAAPLPARLVFPCAPSGLTIVCTTCEESERVYLADELPPIPMTSFSREVELLVRAPGFRRANRKVSLHPGPNTVRLELERLPG